MLLIKSLASQQETITTKDAYQLLSHTYYHNGDKYVSEILTRMVRSGHLLRISRGIYKSGMGLKKSIEIPNQIKLL